MQSLSVEERRGTSGGECQGARPFELAGAASRGLLSQPSPPAPKAFGVQEGICLASLIEPFQGSGSTVLQSQGSSFLATLG